MEDKNINSYEEVRYLDPMKTKFNITPGGILAMNIEPDEFYPRVHLYKMLPFTREIDYISVTDKDGKEIGILRSLNDFPDEVIEILNVELNRRYFVPVIKKINSIKDEFGYIYWEAETDCGLKRFTTRSGHHQVIQLEDNRILIIDLDGNRFEIKNYKKIGHKYERIIQTLL